MFPRLACRATAARPHLQSSASRPRVASRFASHGPSTSSGCIAVHSNVSFEAKSNAFGAGFVTAQAQPISFASETPFASSSSSRTRAAPAASGASASSSPPLQTKASSGLLGHASAPLPEALTAWIHSNSAINISGGFYLNLDDDC
ncbi:hypothetical protein BC830DRAFT_1165730 [Chytriomyces sp. MP71]|nr:hypothetical protein BC830DRAFT_1165730 [Chytriomyces sp. MP71]